MFYIRLRIDLKSYIFYLIQKTRTTKKTLIVDEMIMIFANHDKRLQHRKNNETMTFATRFVDKSKSFNQCIHYDKTDHNQERC